MYQKYACDLETKKKKNRGRKTSPLDYNLSADKQKLMVKVLDSDIDLAEQKYSAPTYSCKGHIQSTKSHLYKKTSVKYI